MCAGVVRDNYSLSCWSGRLFWRPSAFRHSIPWPFESFVVSYQVVASKASRVSMESQPRVKKEEETLANTVRAPSSAATAFWWRPSHKSKKGEANSRPKKKGRRRNMAPQFCVLTGKKRIPFPLSFHVSYLLTWISSALLSDILQIVLPTGKTLLKIVKEFLFRRREAWNRE